MQALRSVNRHTANSSNEKVVLPVEEYTGEDMATPNLGLTLNRDEIRFGEFPSGSALCSARGLSKLGKCIS